MDTRCLLFVGLFVVFIPALLARRNDEGFGKKMKHSSSSSCGNWSTGPCVLKDKTATCGVGKKLATPTDENCPLKPKRIHCKVPCEDQSEGLATGQSPDCKYKKPRNFKSRDIKCDPLTNQHEMTLKLVKGDPSCPSTKVVSKECRKRHVRSAARENRKAGERKQKKTAAPAAAAATTPTTTTVSIATPKTAECKYRKAKGPKAACDPVTNTRTVVKQLKKNGAATCEPTKTSTEPCQASKVSKKEGRKNGGRKNA